MNNKAHGSGYFRIPDLFIILVFLSIAAFSVDMFRRDLLQTFSLQNVEPAGIVIIKKNTVQRRISGRVLWDRLARESPVYIGDLIRVAEISAATLHIGDNSIDLDENTLIRIIRTADGEGLQIVLSEGAISLTTGTEESIGLDLNVIQVLAGPETILSAAASKNGDIFVQVHEGNVQIVEADGAVREIPSGTMFAVDTDRTELPVTAAVIIQPVPNARYVKIMKEPLTINFLWNRINLSPSEKLRLEIASDRNFTRVFSVIENLDTQAQVQLDSGLWYWRLSFGDTVLSERRLTVADGSGPELQSPAFNSLFRYRDEPPVLNFQWTEVPEAVSYIVEVSNTADFFNPQIRRQSSTASITGSALGEGSWFWRVMPVFPTVFSGSAVFSTASFFRLERIPPAPAETVEAGETSATVEASVTAETVSLSQWLATQAPSEELPPELPPEIIPPQFVKPLEPPPEPPTPEIIPQQPTQPEPPPPQPQQQPQITPRQQPTSPPRQSPPQVTPRQQPTPPEPPPGQSPPPQQPTQITPQQIIRPPEPPPQQPTQITPQQPTPPEPPPEPPPPQINLSSPAQEAQIDGLTALRQQTVFRWDTDTEAVRSRFVLSRDSDPLQGQPEQEIPNPDRAVRIDSLAEGTWYWTVELQTSGGLTASAPARRLQVLPIPLLPPPQDLQPATGTSFGLQDFRTQRTIVFNWSEVPESNGYIFTLYQQDSTGRREIVRETINSGTSYTLTDLRLLDRGIFVWQVEAINIGRANTIEQYGTAGESIFIIDFPSSAPLQIEDTGIMYGN